MPVIDMTGCRFGRLTVISRSGNINNGAAAWVCKCDCGTVCVVKGNYLRSGHTESCGCLQRERAYATCIKSGRQKTVTHDMIKTPEYRAWRHIKERCGNKNNKRYRDYGGRGISICKEWKESFEVFFKYVGPRPAPHLSIDRINNDGNYEQGNVRWATRSQQQRNKRKRVKWLEKEEQGVE